MRMKPSWMKVVPFEKKKQKHPQRSSALSTMWEHNKNILTVTQEECFSTEFSHAGDLILDFAASVWGHRLLSFLIRVLWHSSPDKLRHLLQPQTRWELEFLFLSSGSSQKNQQNWQHSDELSLFWIKSQPVSLSLKSFLWADWAFLVAQLVKNPPAVQETLVRFLGQEDPLEKG